MGKHFEMMEEYGYVCKLCNKKYPCGKSLGGHMRSHVVEAANAAESKAKNEPNSNLRSVVKETKLAELADEQLGYGLRENPRKIWRMEDVREERVCRRCGKGFQSKKALNGHMASHTERERGDLRDDQLWTSENPKMVLDSCSDTEAEDGRIMMQKRLSGNKRCKRVMDESPPLNGSSSVSEIGEQDQEEVAVWLMMLSMDNGSKGCVESVVESLDNNSVVVETKPTSVYTKIVRKEIGHNKNPQKVANEDTNVKDATLEDEVAQMEDSDSAYFLEERTKGEEPDVSVDGIHKYGALGECKNPITSRVNFYEVRKSLKLIKSRQSKENEYDEDDMALIFAGIESRKRKDTSEHPQSENPLKESRYECLNCGKTFKSYQALGGHRQCHKRSNAFYDSRYESDENSLGDSSEYHTSGKLIDNKGPSAKSASNCGEKKIKSKDKKEHICPFCNRVFKNGQALGGHKRSHFMSGQQENSNRRSLVKPKHPNVLDLNHPVPEVDKDKDDEDERGQLFSR